MRTSRIRPGRRLDHGPIGRPDWGWDVDEPQAWFPGAAMLPGISPGVDLPFCICIHSRNKTHICDCEANASPSADVLAPDTEPLTTLH